MQKKPILVTASFCVFAVACYFGGQALKDYVSQRPTQTVQSQPATQTPEVTPSPSATPKLPFEFVSEPVIYTSAKPSEDPAPEKAPDPTPVNEVGAVSNMAGGGSEMDTVDDVYMGEQHDEPAKPSEAPAPEKAPEPTPTPKPTPTPTPKPTQSGAYGTYDANGKPLWKGTDGEKSPDGKWSVKGSGNWGPYYPEYDDSEMVTGGLTGNKVGSM